jgi:hypothetical protein
MYIVCSTCHFVLRDMLSTVGKLQKNEHMEHEIVHGQINVHMIHQYAKLYNRLQGVHDKLLQVDLMHGCLSVKDTLGCKGYNPHKVKFMIHCVLQYRSIATYTPALHST